MEKIIKDLGGRKFLMTMAILAVLTLFVCLDKMTSEQFIILLPIISGSYIAGNVAQKFSK